MTHEWRLLHTPPLPGAQNMAIDQALLDLHPALQQPTLRLYGWSPPCVSLGLAQRLERDVDVEACARRGINIVRRPTGGRAILHDHELTYALVIAVDHPLIRAEKIVQSYRAISEALCAGLFQLGVEAELAPQPDRFVRKSAACFDLPGDYEITVRGRKLVGSAQARQQRVLLQHGSLLLHADTEILAEVLRLPTLNNDDLAQRMIALDEALGYVPTWDAVAAALVRGFEQAWKIALQPGELTEAEHQHAANLVQTRFGHADWTARR